MRSHFSEDVQETAHSHAADRHKQPEPHANSFNDYAAILALSVAFGVLVLVALRPTAAPPPAPASQAFELPVRPIWVNNLPFAPRDGQSPDWVATFNPVPPKP
jgi:hypothetical protein